jgi:hypothetical protein
MNEKIDWFEKPHPITPPDMTYTNYRQIFLPPVVLTCASKRDIFWFNVQKYLGIIAIQRWCGHPHGWDEKAVPYE